jgi:transcriptional regulator with XRE-family HTH domain
MAKKYINVELNKIIGKKLLRVRQRTNFSQQNVAFDLGISATTYSKLENGRQDFTATHFCQLADYFKVNISDFLDSNIETPRLLKDMKSPEDYKTLELQRDLHRDLFRQYLGLKKN